MIENCPRPRRLSNTKTTRGYSQPIAFESILLGKGGQSCDGDWEMNIGLVYPFCGSASVRVAQPSPAAGSRAVPARVSGTGGGTPPQPAGGDACATADA